MDIINLEMKDFMGISNCEFEEMSTELCNAVDLDFNYNRIAAICRDCISKFPVPIDTAASIDSIIYEFASCLVDKNMTTRDVVFTFMEYLQAFEYV